MASATKGFAPLEAESREYEVPSPGSIPKISSFSL